MAVLSSFPSARAASAMVDWGPRPSALATSPNCRSRSTMATRPGARAASLVARLVATVVLPAPPLGDITVMTRPRGARACWAWTELAAPA